MRAYLGTRSASAGTGGTEKGTGSGAYLLWRRRPIRSSSPWSKQPCDESLSISSLAARNAAAGSKLFHEKDEKAVAGSVVDGDLPIRQMVELMTRNKPFDIVGCPFIWYKNCRSTERSRGRSSSYMYLLDLRTISYVDRGIPHSTKSRNGSVSNLSFFAAYRRSHVPVDLVVHCSASLAT